MLAGAAPAFAVEPAGSTSLAEVIVTAQKRTENVQNVPVSIQVLGTQKLDALNIKDFNDYIKFLPSVVYQSFGPGLSNVYMRGVAADNQSNHSGSLPSVGTYLDEAPITTTGGALDIHVYDIARVESLSGPQGTLYGASSEAGTIRIITNQPQIGVFTGAYDIQGNTVGHGGQGYSGEGFVNIPLGDKAAIRLVGWGEHDAGYIDNVPGTLTFPSSGITVDNRAFVKNDYNDVNTYGGRAALKFDLGPNWTITPSIIAQDEKNNGIFGYEPSVGDLKVSHFRPENQHDRWYQAALTVQGKISDFDVTYAASHMDRRLDSSADYTDYSFFYDQVFGSGAYIHNDAGQLIDPTQTIIGRDRFIKDSHEFRISSAQGNRFRFTAGVFYEKQQHYIYQNYNINNLGKDITVTGFPNTLWLTDQYRQDEDFATFGEASFDLRPNLTLTGGIRLYTYDNSLAGFYGFSAGYSSHTGESQCFGPPTRGLGPCTNLNKDVSQSGETHKVNLTWRIDPEKMVYATYSTGFRPGGVNRNGNLGPYQPDYLDNYEVGWKTSWLDSSVRWNGALFYEKWKDFQFSYLGLNSLTVVNNAGNARILGVESDATWRPIRQFTVNGALAYTDATLRNDFCGLSPGESCVGQVIQAPKGTQLPVTPKFKANGTARYEFQAAGLNAYLQGVVVYQSSSWSDLLIQAPVPSTNPPRYVPVRGALGLQQAYTTADFSAGISHANWSI
ncbi:MAG: TonB-dependent receptor, partial [Caulobacteraceae bacterium]